MRPVQVMTWLRKMPSSLAPIRSSGARDIGMPTVPAPALDSFADDSQNFDVEVTFPAVARHLAAIAFQPGVHSAPPIPTSATPNHALQRTAALAFSYRARITFDRLSHGVCSRRGSPGIRRAFALRRRAHERASGLRSLSLGSLGVIATRHPVRARYGRTPS